MQIKRADGYGRALSCANEKVDAKEGIMMWKSSWIDIEGIMMWKSSWMDIEGIIISTLKGGWIRESIMIWK